jgi:hypothetical protein
LHGFLKWIISFHRQPKHYLLTMKYLLSLICFIAYLTATGFAVEVMHEDVPPGDEMAIDVPTVAVKFTKESTVADFKASDLITAHSIKVIENTACAKAVIDALFEAKCSGVSFPHLTEFKIIMSDIAYADVADLAYALPSMPALTYLTLTDTNLCNDGMHAIAKALDHPHLALLILCGNSFGYAGAQALAASLPRLQGLMRLYLIGTPVCAEGRKAIKDACKGMPRLREVAYDHRVSPSGREYVLARPPRS